MNTNLLLSFVTVIEVGSISEASRRLDLAPTAIAARKHILEQELSVAIIKRAGRSVKATEAGLKIVKLRSLSRDLRAVAGDGIALGKLRLGVFAS